MLSVGVGHSLFTNDLKMHLNCEYLNDKIHRVSMDVSLDIGNPEPVSVCAARKYPLHQKTAVFNMASVYGCIFHCKIKLNIL